MFDGADFFARADFQILGKTSFFDFQQPFTNDRDAVILLDARLGVEVAYAAQNVKIEELLNILLRY